MQKLIQTQQQTQQQVQKLSQQQMLQVKLLEMPVAELEESIQAELDDNPALEIAPDGYDDTEEANGTSDGETDGGGDAADAEREREERDEALEGALQGLGSDDEMPAARGGSLHDEADYEEMVYGSIESFYDKLKEQTQMLDISDELRQAVDYLIGSLDSDGLLRRDLASISDELAIYNNIDITESQLHEALSLLQSLDPAGIGARSLQECLLLQIDRRSDGKVKQLMHDIIAHHYEEFTKKHWAKIQQSMRLTDVQTQALIAEIRKLNPKPGASLGEAESRNMQQITPDFIIDVDDDGRATFTLNYGHVPELHVSSSFLDMVDTYRNNRKGMSRRDKEALLYAKEKVEKAQGYIEAIKQRRHTLHVTMKAIIEWQRKYFAEGDESDLRPMILKDIAERTGLDISTISRVNNQKYAQTPWGTFPLRFFFSDGYDTGSGEELSTRKIKLALKDIISKEDKHHPKSDEMLTRLMAERGFPIARRTIAKYREQMGIPVARLRRQ